MKLLVMFFLGLLVMPGVPAHAGNGAPACPSQDLSTFLIAFSESIELQKAFTQFPLKKSYYDHSSKIPYSRVDRSLSREQIQFPLIPNAAERKANDLRLLINVDEETALKAGVKLQKNTADLTYYYFTRGTCWELVGIDDYLN